MSTFIGKTLTNMLLQVKATAVCLDLGDRATLISGTSGKMRETG
jgi:hypothetical protein